MATWRSVDLPVDVVELILDYLPLQTLYRIILCRHKNIYFNLIASSLRSFRLSPMGRYTAGLSETKIVDAAFDLVRVDDKKNISNFDIDFLAESDVAENELAQRILSLVQKQSVIHSFCLISPYKYLASQESFFRTFLSYNGISHLRSFRCSSSACGDHLLPLLERTPHLKELVIDDFYSKVIPLLPHLPRLTPKLELLIFSTTNPYSSGELSWSCLSPLKELKNLSKIMVPRAFQKLGWRKALEFLPASLALNICFAELFHPRNEGSGISFLHDLIATNDVSQARLLIELGAQVGRYSDPICALWRTKPLHEAIRRKSIPLCRLLIESGAALSDPHNLERGALFAAISIGHSPVIKLILDTIEEGKYETWYPRSPLLFNARTGESVFHAAAKKRSLEPLRLCLAQVPKDVINVDNFDGLGLPPLAYVATADHARLLLAHGADPNVQIPPYNVLLIEFLLREPTLCEVAERLLQSAAFLSKVQLGGDVIETLLDGARHPDSRTRHIFSSACILEVMIKTFPADKLEDMLQRINFWLSLPVLTPVAELLAIVHERVPTFVWRPEMTTALRSSLKLGFESRLKGLDHLVSIRADTIDVILPILFEPDVAKQAQERSSTFFEPLVNFIIKMVTTHHANSRTLTLCLFACLRSLKLGGNVTDLISALLLRGAEPVDAECSSSLILELSKRNYPGVMQSVLEKEPAVQVFGSPAHDLEGFEIAKQKYRSRNHGWTAQLITLLEQRMQQQHTSPSVLQ